MAPVNREEIGDEHFMLVANFDVVVPDRYDHARLTREQDTFRERNAYKEGEKTEKEKYGKPHYYDSFEGRKNFESVVEKLAPGRKLNAKILEVDKKISLDNCLGFLKRQGAIFAGVSGVILTHWGNCIAHSYILELPKRSVFVCFDERDILWKGSCGYHMVPYVMNCSSGGPRMLYLDSEQSLDYGFYKSFFVLCLCEG